MLNFVEFGPSYRFASVDFRVRVVPSVNMRPNTGMPVVFWFFPGRQVEAREGRLVMYEVLSLLI